MDSLSLEERKKLRLARFGNAKGNGMGGTGAATTLEAMQMIEE